MGNRVTDADVQAIKSTSLDTTPFITAANAIVSQVNDKCGTSFDEDALTQIELFLSAHFVCAADPELTSEKFENASKTFQRGTSMSGLLSTNYGQIANSLADGCLVNFDQKAAVVQFA